MALQNLVSASLTPEQKSSFTNKFNKGKYPMKIRSFFKGLSTLFILFFIFSCTENAPTETKPYTESKNVSQIRIPADKKLGKVEVIAPEPYALQYGTKKEII
ncbi:MAG: hypothetical protein M1391_15105, partial [Bacteroidetes bacterium]|nr:hypothetical protein [Bacteroidota bacterium]